MSGGGGGGGGGSASGGGSDSGPGSAGSGPDGGPSGIGMGGAFGDFSGDFGGASSGPDPTTTSLANSIISFALPFPLNGLHAVLSSFDKGLANFAQPSPDDPGPMGGPGDGFLEQLYPRPPAPPGPQPFQINPMQVQNDMRGGWGNQGQGGWGGGYQQPQMNPFSMYGSGQPANRGYNPFSMYGGK